MTAAQMRDMEAQLFAAGMPVAALMEKVAGLVANRIQALYPRAHGSGRGTGRRVGVLVGPGHNGGDALVVARELHLQGDTVFIHAPIAKQKPLTADHAQYARYLGIPFVDTIEPLLNCDLVIDGLFGFGLERPLIGEIATLVDRVSQAGAAIVSIDLPSGLHTDTGVALGTAIRADYTLCLGLWKRGLLQETALAYAGQMELIDFGIPLAAVTAVLGTAPPLRRLTAATAIAHLPLQRPATTHKYKQGHLLLIAGSERYQGAALLAGLGARASGVGMLSIAVPQHLKPFFVNQLPDALILGCPETETGAIAQLPADLDLATACPHSAIAIGPGLTIVPSLLAQVYAVAPCPLLLDADGLNWLATQAGASQCHERPAPTILTPHAGEFRRLFPTLVTANIDGISQAERAAQVSGAIVVRKGARTIIATPDGTCWVNPNSTPALARGGSGDVLTGLLGGLLAQAAMTGENLGEAIAAGVWWHSQAACLAAADRTVLGVDAQTLSAYLLPALQRHLSQP
ncbi:NAD(P)H-hydrate dehydratase [Trichothermofontia sp.]